MSMPPARKAALLRLLEDKDRGLATSEKMLRDGWQLTRLADEELIEWVRGDLWTLTPAGYAAAKAAREEGK